MCGSISNLPQNARGRCELPNGAVVNFKELDEDFAAITSEERGRISRKVLAALPKRERDEFKDKIRSAMKKSSPLDDAALELVVFLAVGHHAVRNDLSVHDAAQLIVGKQSGVGVILRAA